MVLKAFSVIYSIYFDFLFKYLVHTVSPEAFLERKHCYGTKLITTSGVNNKQLAEVDGQSLFE